jgi:uncharacterized Zn-finger protein
MATHVFECEHIDCRKSFATKSKLNIHIKRHEGVKCHPCTYAGCDQSFVTKCNLNRHIKYHEGVECHPCTYAGCGQSYVTKAHLNRHSNVHTEEYHQKQKKEEEKIAKLFHQSILEHLFYKHI